MKDLPLNFPLLLFFFLPFPEAAMQQLLKHFCRHRLFHTFLIKHISQHNRHPILMLQSGKKIFAQLPYLFLECLLISRIVAKPQLSAGGIQKNVLRPEHKPIQSQQVASDFFQSLRNLTQQKLQKLFSDLPVFQQHLQCLFGGNIVIKHHFLINLLNLAGQKAGNLVCHQHPYLIRGYIRRFFPRQYQIAVRNISPVISLHSNPSHHQETAYSAAWPSFSAI